MKRAPLARRTPLARGPAPTRRTPMKRRRLSPKAFAALRDPEYRAWIRTLSCTIGRDCAGQMECAHVKSRGAGGADVANTVPLCLRHHREQHRIGIRSFEAKYGVHLATRALSLGAVQPAEIGRKRMPFIREYWAFDALDRGLEAQPTGLAHAEGEG